VDQGQSNGESGRSGSLNKVGCNALRSGYENNYMNGMHNGNGHSVFGRFFRWFSGRRIIRRILIGLAGLIALIAVIYIEEDWRGNRVWENYKRSLAAEGEVLDWNAYIPAPVPDDQNVFKASRMTEWFAATYRNLHNPVTNELAKSLSNPQTTADLTDKNAAANYLAWSAQFEPEFETMRAALNRPFVRLDGDYRQPLTIPVLNLPSMRMVVLTLTQRAKCQLLLGEPEKSWQNLTLLLDMGQLVPDKPTGKPMVINPYAIWAKRGLAMQAVDIIHRGLDLHAWQEPQLAVLEDRLKDIDFIGLQAEACKTGRALETTTSFDFVYQVALCEDPYTNFWQRVKEPSNLFVWLAPRGWVYLWIVHLGEGFQKSAEILGGNRGVLIPAQISQVTTWWLGREALPLLAFNQTMVNETRLACALERYHFLHNEYPESLDALAPRFIGKIPLDLVGGQPLHYHRKADGNFLLYSVGWNESDDGGQVLSEEDRPENLKKGDWVWKNRSKQN
jgi:hypothetical protein